MSIRDLAHRIAMKYPGGIAALAVRMKPPKPGETLAQSFIQVLRNKLNPNSTTHHLYIEEFEDQVDLADANLEVAEHFAQKANAVVISLPMLACDGSDMELLDGFLEIVRELGEFSAEFQKSWADGRITADEFARLSAEARDIQARVVAQLGRIEQVVDWPKAPGAAAKPARKGRK